MKQPWLAATAAVWVACQLHQVGAESVSPALHGIRQAQFYQKIYHETQQQEDAALAALLEVLDQTAVVKTGEWDAKYIWDFFAGEGPHQALQWSRHALALSKILLTPVYFLLTSMSADKPIYWLR